MTDPITITPLTCEFPEPMALNPLEIHRHDHEELWIITHGNPVHSIDFIAETLKSPVIVYVTRGKVHSFLPDQPTQGWLIRYKSDFIPQSRLRFYSAFPDKVHYQLTKDYCSTTLQSLCTTFLIFRAC